MKRLIALFVSLLMLALVGCGGNDDAPTAASQAEVAEVEAAASTADSSALPPSQAEGETAPGAAMESLIDWMMGGTFSYDFALTSEYEGQTTESTGSVAMDGNNYAIVSETMVEGVAVKSRIVVLDDVTYIIDDASRLVMEMANTGPEMTGGMPTDYEDMASTGSGQGEVNGRTLPYEEYTVDGVNVKYYMDGGMVYAIESVYEGAYTLMIISNARNTVPAGAFDIPDDYMTMSV